MNDELASHLSTRVLEHLSTLKKHLHLILFALLAIQASNAHAQSCFAQVSVSPREGVVRQPFKVSISVHTTTWFTSPLQFQNLQVDNAFILPYTQTTPSTSYINKKKYATLTFYYVVYPFVEGELTIPSLNITANTPPEGDYKGVPMEIHTKAQKIKVNAVPTADGAEVWNVASSMTLSEQWDKDLKTIKVGDVLNRTVKQYAAGTLPNFIQPIELPELEGVSNYASEPQFKERRTQSSINGELTQHVAYLFETEGTVQLPEQEVYWYNPSTKRVYQRALPAQEIHVQANPDLAMLSSLKDSLDALNAASNPEAAEGKRLPWKRLLVISVLAILILYYIVSKMRKLIPHLVAKRKAYLQSELHKRRKFHRTLRGRNRRASINALYCWFDAHRGEGSADISSTLPIEAQQQWAALLHASSEKLQAEEIRLMKQLEKQVSQISAKKQIEDKLNP